ncbi:sigma-54-dependent transcriptional regulator [Desulfatirhabdium butyrativorans]|uniref:sigma-54-dependent transcriptional regulator n=1 Tax=Desulfatirhabdium butyrativorans TaxID=340467 RepID=UPI000686DC15|nr:sigma-54 dependent transcriptional regulator [Desulfatirhabdium butyrativorans]
MKFSRMKILLSFIGNNDCYPFESPGAILSILQQRQFDRLYLLINSEKYLKPASDIIQYCTQHYPRMAVEIQQSMSENPADYNTVYPAMYQAVKNILFKTGNAEYWISLTSGTPVMHACWIFLQQGGVIDARLIQVSRNAEISDVTFELDDFPEIRQTEAIKAEITRLSRENKDLRRIAGLTENGIIGQCPSIITIREQIERFADTNIPIFISGESGTGKELVAEAIHFRSSRKDKPFIPVNCGAIPSELFESEFFGHKKGAFTGAISDRQGIFKQANGGTVFLDEIADLLPAFQVKLLRFVDSGKFAPVGGNSETSDVRIVSATHKDIRDMVRAGTFREDLFYRLVHTELHLPPLRSRGNDIILIAQHLTNNLNLKYGNRKRLSSDAVDRILKSSWPGNIRQMKNVLETAYVLSDDTIAAEHLHIMDVHTSCSQIEIPDAGIDLENDIMPRYYDVALKKTGGNAEKAARLLGLKPHTFRARLKALKSKSFDPTS